MAIELIIDGSQFHDYEGFVREFNSACVATFGAKSGLPWNGEIDDLHDLLEAHEEAAQAEGERLTVRWINSHVSRSELGHEAMAEFWLRSRASVPETAFTSAGRELVIGWKQEGIDQARAGHGRTLFEYLVWQIAGDEEDNCTEVILEY